MKTEPLRVATQNMGWNRQMSVKPQARTASIRKGDYFAKRAFGLRVHKLTEQLRVGGTIHYPLLPAEAKNGQGF